MRRSARLVLDQGIRAEFSTTLSYAPSFSGRNQRSADTLPSRLGNDVPAIEIRHSIRFAPFGVRTNRQLHKANTHAGTTDSEQHFERRPKRPGKVLLNLRRMRRPLLVGPERISA